MGNTIDLKKINGLRKKVLNAIEQVDIQQKKLTEKYTQKIKDEFDLICQKEIDKFYLSYPNPRYDRYGDLYNTYKIIINKYSGEFSVRFSSAYMKYQHRADNETIYVNSFIEGYHGGAYCARNFKGKPHPDGKTPYWKNPLTNYYTWLSPAKKTESPYKEIIKQFSIKEEEIQSDLENDFENTMMNIITPINNEINSLLGK